MASYSLYSRRSSFFDQTTMHKNTPYSNQQEPGRTFRMACRAQDHELARELLNAQGYTFTQESFSDLAFALTSEPQALGGSLANRFGLIYIQDRSSMLPPLMLNPKPGEAVLDMCASPGGKTGLLSLLVGPEGFVIGNEPNPARLETLRRNLHRNNALNSATCSFNGEEIPLEDESFQSILLDPPCSGWGTVNKNPNVIDMWSGDKTEPLEKLQRKLLERAAELLVPGGHVLYSTCTTNPRENEDQVDFAIRELGLELEPLEHPAGFTVDKPTLAHLEGVLRVGGGQEGGQGFFLARLKKPGTPVAPKRQDKFSLPGKPLTRAEKELCTAAGIDLDALPPGEIYNFGGKLFFIHEQAMRIIPSDMRWQGVPIGKYNGKKVKADARLRSLLPSVESGAPYVDVESVETIEALFSGQSIPAPAKGNWAGLAFKGKALARLVVKGSRALWSDR
ncbi:RsmB/NOP family class I SAM-dependent RNA methyltransferase [Desulfobaculum bizertense]|uniref:16S rRNA (Cytosine1407-C5)-methyltransferase n=1 Tax=Desulfobaculum bizertense DSM 18034 TaxID=1121442 RepID=A0A1T4X5D5_9BACT|nr:RsmB/NOP family class I SAM-dependent RNA methyltransferase [Desulfobaculum bizertense]SKA84275.1 16S rRNA (cytosine1407-C5)-methyltransferase [Desulfobaculum bizertense DSM 18034]